MGYKPRRTVYKLDFSETEHAGLEVTIRSAPIEQLLALEEFGEQDGLGADAARDMFRQFASLLVSWNVEDDDGQPVPATYEGVITQEPEFIQELIRMWLVNMTQAPPPLPAGSSSGATSPEEQTLGLDASSRSLRT